MESRASYLLARLDDLRRAKTSEWREKDLEDLGREVAEYVRDTLDVASLERELVSRAQLDVRSLEKAVRLFEELAAEPTSVFQLLVGGTSTPIDWHARLTTLRDVADGLVAAEKLENLEIVLRLNLAADPALDLLLVALPPGHPARDEVRKSVREKLDLLSNEKALEFWTQLRFQVDPSRDGHYELDDDIAARAFFDLGDATEVRDRIARYVAVVRPLLERRMIEKGVHRFPAGPAGVATILTWTKEPATTDWNTGEQLIIRALGRIAALWRGDKAVLADALGLLREGYFLHGRAEREAKRFIDSNAQKVERDELLLAELTKLVRVATQRRSHLPGTVERILRAFKLGMEVTAEDHLTDLRRRNELYFQRQLLRFLVERDIAAYGTKFGRSEVDVRADDPLGAVVVETKLLKGALSESTINRWLTQLGSYMDEAHVALRGALVIFNFGDAPILCPVTSLRYRYLLVTVNLCGSSPSKRKAGVEIEETPSGPGLVRITRLDQSPPATKRKKKPVPGRRRTGR